VFGFVEMVFAMSKSISSRVPIKALILFLRAKVKKFQKGGPSASGRALPPVTKRSRVQALASAHLCRNG
jgi:hypothetical protein